MAASAGQISVLHVDDEPGFAELVAEFLGRHDDRLAVETAGSVDEGLEKLRANGFDCVVSDYDMPGLDGIEFLEAVREDYPDLPFILYTGKGSEEVASDAISAGVTDYLQKESGTSQYEILANRITNVVEQSRARDEAAETERRLRTLAEHTNDVLWKFTGDWDELLFINSAYEDIWGRSVAELREEPQSFLEGVYPDDRDEVVEAMEALSNGESIDLEYRVNADEDYERWVWVEGEPIAGDDGEVDRVVGFARDITERKAESERFETLIEHSMDIVAVLDEAGTIRYQSPSVERILGYKPEDLVGENGFEYVHPDDQFRVIEKFNDIIEQPDAVTDRVTYRFRHEDGSWVWLETVGRNERDSAIGGYVLNSRDVTEREERKRALEASEERFRSIAESASDAIVTIDTASTVTFANPAIEDIFGYAPEEVEGESLTMLMPVRYRDRHRVGIDRYLDTGNRSFDWSTVELAGQHRDGRELDLHISFSEFEHGEDRRFTGIIRDVTDRDGAPGEGMASEKRFRALFEQSPDGVLLYDDEGDIIDANPRACENLGYAYDELVEMEIWDISSADPEEVFPRWEAMDIGDTATFEGVHERADGTTFPVRVRVARVDLEPNVSFIAISRDVSELAEREAELERERDRVNALFQNSRDAIVYTEYDDGDPIVRDVNTAFEETFGYDAEEAVGRPIDDLVVPDDESMREEARGINQRIEDGELVITEVRRRTPDGPQDFLLQSTPLEPDSGNTRTYAIYSDISERKSYERSLQGLHEASERLLSAETTEAACDVVVDISNTVLDHPYAGVWLWNPESERLEPVARSEGATDALGSAPTFEVGEGLIGSAYESGERIVLDDAPEDPRAQDPGDRDIRGYGVFPIGDHGVIVFASPEVGAFDDRDAALASNLAAHTTVALDRITREEALRERERTLERQNERLDQFASVVSHDLRNPLNVAQGRLELALQDLQSDDLDREDLEAVERAHARMESLIEDMLSLARAGDAIGETEPVNLTRLLGQCWDTVDTDDADLVVDTERTVHADRTRLQQLLENLLRNAIEYGGPGVTVTVGDLEDGFYVEDDGPGIPEDERGKVLRPGYSSAGGGTGFGLSIVRDIAEAHGWSVAITEGSAGGARFEFTDLEP